MRITHYNTFAHGGSAVVMVRLHQALRELGHDSQACSRERIEKVPGAQEVLYLHRALARWRARTRYSLENRMLRQAKRSYFSRLVTPVRTPAVEALDTDVVHLHWVNRWLDLPSFTDSLPTNVPLVWTVHDMSALAGGCFTDFGCGEFAGGCQRCPLLRWPVSDWWAKQELQRRQKALAGRPMAFVANSRSTMRLVERSVLASGARKVVIPPGIDCQTFCVREKAEARRALGIEPDGFVLGFAAAALTDRNKGIDRFYAIAQRAAGQIAGTRALLLGDGKVEAPMATDFLGLVKEPERLNLAYAAMDALVIPSQMETFGQVAVEAQACGRPVWAFAVGGLPETLQAGTSGELHPFDDCEAMAHGIVAAKQAGHLEEMGAAGVRWVRGNFDCMVVAKRYVQLYEELIEAGNKFRSHCVW